MRIFVGQGTMAEWLGSALQKLLQQFESVWYLASRTLLAFAGFFLMLTKQEEDFVRYWSEQRLKKKQFLRKFSIGLPLGVFIAVALVINFLSGWYKKADMELRADSSVIIVVLIAALAIVVFVSLFATRYRWDQNEQHYQELLRKKGREA